MPKIKVHLSMQQFQWKSHQLKSNEQRYHMLTFMEIRWDEENNTKFLIMPPHKVQPFFAPISENKHPFKHVEWRCHIPSFVDIRL